MAPGQVGEFCVQRGDPVRIVRDGPVDRDRRAVVGLEVVAEVLGTAEPGDPEGLAPGRDVGDLVAEQRPDMASVTVAPVGGVVGLVTPRGYS